MNLLLLAESDRLEENRFVLADRRVRHVLETLDKKTGDTIRIGLEDGPIGTAKIVEHSSDHLVLDAAFTTTPERPLVELIVAVPRPKSLKKILAEVAAMGVAGLVFIRTWRVDKAYLSSPLLTPDGYRPLLVDGLMQAKDTRVPEVRIAPLFKPFVEDEAPAFVANKRAFVLDPSAKAHLADTRIEASESVVLAIGPEGGFLPYEVEAFQRAGFEARHMGPRILRVETACISALATIQTVRRRAD